MPSYIYNATTKELENVAGGTLYAEMPIGTIVPFGGGTVPNGYELCDGSEVLKTDYPDLYAVIGDAFGTASVNTKFKLPDLREVVPVGSGTRGSGVSAHDTYTVGQFKDDQLQNHTHSLHRASDGGSVRGVLYRADTADGFYGFALGSEETQIHATTIETGRTGTTTHGKQLGVNYIIKALKTALPIDLTEEIDDVKDEVNDILNVYGSKNMLPQNGWTTLSSDSLTVTKNGDGSITVNGTNPSSTDSVYFVISDLVIPPSGDYILSSGSSNSKVGVFANVQGPGGVYVKTLGMAFDSEEFINIDYSGYINVKFGVAVRPNATVNNLVIYPMMRKASIEDGTYVPYAMTNKELTDVTYATATTDSTYVNGGYIYYCKLGKLVIVNVVNLSITSATTASTVLCTLPKPKIIFSDYKVRTCMWTTGGRTYGNTALFEVDARDGKVTLDGYLPTAITESVYGQMSYLTD